ncbi:unnamed protein product [Sphagnum jensenii]
MKKRCSSYGHVSVAEGGELILHAKIVHHTDSASRISCPFLGQIPAQNLLPKAIQDAKSSRWANSGRRIRCHPNGKILASESDGIPMDKFWHQNQMASQWADSGSRIRGHFWQQNQMAFQWPNSGTRIRHHPNILKCEAGGQAVEDFVRSLAHPN